MCKASLPCGTAAERKRSAAARVSAPGSNQKTDKQAKPQPSWPQINHRKASIKSNLKLGRNCGDFAICVKAFFVEAFNGQHSAILLTEKQRESIGLGCQIVKTSVTLSRMAEDDFDVQSLAAYLHLQAAQVVRLADRDKLPGRKVQGQWRFSQADIHHWLENRIGLSDQAELEEMETILRPAVADRPAPQNITAMLPLAAIEVSLAARTRNSVITSMAEIAARTGWLWDAQKMAGAVLDREDMHPTALENGVALLHPRRPMASILGHEFLAFGRTASAMPFGGDHGALTDLFFLICSTDDRGHLQTLARLSRLIGDPGLLIELREATDAAAVQEAIAAAETRIKD